MLTRLANLFADVKNQGPLAAAKYYAHRLNERYFEHRFGITTAHCISLKEFGIENGEFIEYDPVPYRTLMALMNKVGRQAMEGSFLDYGCGMGRAIIVGATYPFRRVIGVEIVPELAKTAQENIRRTHRKLRCRDIAIATADVASYDVPEDVTLIHFFNSCRGRTLARMIEQIERSYAKRPRQLTVLAGNSNEFDRSVRASGILRKSWEHSFYHPGCPALRNCYVAYQTEAAQ